MNEKTPITQGNAKDGVKDAPKGARPVICPLVAVYTLMGKEGGREVRP